MTRYAHLYNERFASKWLILFIDMAICAVAFGLAVLLRYNLSFTYLEPELFKYHILLVLLIKTLSFLYFNTYEGVVRHTSLEDTIALFKATFIAALLLIALSAIGLNDQSSLLHRVVSIPPSVIGIDFFISLFILVFSRLVIKNIYEQLANGFKSQKFAIVYGAGHLGRITKDTLKKDKSLKYEILCFIDDNPKMIGKAIEGVKILGRQEALERYFQSKNYRDTHIELIFAIQSIDKEVKQAIIDELIDLNIDLKVVPPIKQWIGGELSLNQIKKIRIEDLLERDPISINNQLVASTVKGKVVMVTGAAGSIGSEIVRQLVKYQPDKVVLVDQSESGLYDLETELTRLGEIAGGGRIEAETVNVVNQAKMRELFARERPDLVFHAAAYKHVPLMEKNPFKAFEVNVYGSAMLAELASEFQVEKFVMISTDKAVNPTNVMGASKRLAEMYVHGLNGHPKNKTRFIITRFGNVLGSNGSVIPLFKKQIEAGGPITVTHANIIRYFMTIPEACQLVLEAGTMGKGGEVFVFDMGEPVKIVDLAKRMIKLSGLTIDKDIKIKFTGLRPGEKLYEELLHQEENVLPTYHPKIMIAKVQSPDYDLLSRQLSPVFSNYESLTNDEIVITLKHFVAEYISQNSTYALFDDKPAALPISPILNVAVRPE